MPFYTVRLRQAANLQARRLQLRYSRWQVAQAAGFQSETRIIEIEMATDTMPTRLRYRHLNRILRVLGIPFPFAVVLSWSPERCSRFLKWIDGPVPQQPKEQKTP